MTLDELTQAIAGARERDKYNQGGDTVATADRRALLAVIDQLLPDARRWRDCVEHGFPHVSLGLKGAYYFCYRNDSGATEYNGKTIQDAVDSRLSGPPMIVVTQEHDSAIDRAIEGEQA